MKTVLVTGANRGIGLAIARELVRKDGFQVLGASRDMEAGRAAADETGAVPVKLDLSDTNEIVPQLRHIQDRKSVV